MSDWETEPGWEDEPAKKPVSTWDKINNLTPAKMIANSPFGQTVMGLASGFGGTVAGGIAGLGRTILSGPEEGANTVRRVQDALTYQPESKTAQTASKVVGFLPEQWSKASDWSGEHVAERTGSPALGAAYNAFLQGAPQALGIRLPGMKASAFETAMPGGEFAGSAAKRNAARVAAAQNDAAVAASRAADYKLPPSRINPTSRINNFLESVGGKKDLALDLSEANQAKSQGKVRDDLGLRPDEHLDLDTYEASRAQAAPAYDEMTRALEGAPYSPIPPQPGTGPGTSIAAQVVTPEVVKSQQFLTDVGARRDLLRAKLADAPQNFRSLGPSLELLDEAMAGQEMNHLFVVDRIKQLRSDAKADFKAENRAERLEMGRTRLQLADDIESLVEHNLTQKGDLAALNRFREAREHIAKTYDAEKATLSTGEIYAKALTDSKGHPKPQLTGGLREVADLQAHFPEAAQVPSRGTSTAINPVDLGLGVISHAVGTGKKSLVPLALSAVRSPVRSMLKADWYQDLVRPEYGQSWASRVPQALQQPGVIPGLQAEGLSEKRKKLLQQLLLEGAPQ